MCSQVVSPVFAGRREESARLAAAFAIATAGDPATVLIGGEAGVGKSRLVEEFLRTGPGNVLVLSGGCLDVSGDGLPFAPFVAALRGLPGELTGTERETLAPLLLAPAPRSGDDARLRLFEGLLALLARLAAARPVVLVLEDIHWADRSSRDLIDFLVRNQRAAPGTLLLVTHRSDELGRAHPVRALLAGLGRVPWVERLELRRLTNAAVVAQVRGILGDEPDPESLRGIIARSDGNPLFVEALVDSGPGTTVPASLEDLLLAGVEQLPKAGREVLRAAAVGGARVPHSVLAAVHHGDVTDAVRAAVDAGTLLVDGDDYVFRHALIRDAVHASLLPGERVALHARYAAVLAGVPGAHSRLAHHLSAAGDAPGALAAAWEAAGSARRSLAHAEELRMLERVLELWPDVSDGAERIGHDRAAVLEHAAHAAALAGEPERGERLATAALAELDRGTHAARVALLLDLRARLRGRLGTGGALDDHHAAVRLLPAGHPARGALLNSLAEHLLVVPLPDEARHAAELAREEASAAGDDATEASALITLAVLAARIGDLDGQLPLLAKARALAESAGADGVRLRSLRFEAHLLQAYGRLAESEEVARRGLAAAHQAGLARSAGPEHAVDLIGTLLLAGRWAEAAESLDHAMELTQQGTTHTNLLAYKAYLALHRGELDTAADLAARAKAHSTGSAPPPTLLLVPRLEAELALARGEPAEAAKIVPPALEFPHLAVSSRFTWPLLVVGARVAGAAGDLALLGTLIGQAAGTRIAGPVQAAEARTFEAEAARAQQQPDQALWETAVAAWEPLGHPLHLATALLGLAEARLATGAGRDAAVVPLRRAAELTEALGARPLHDAVTALARRARIGLPGEDGTGEQPRFGLTARELDILRLVAEGLSNREIGERLFISPKTASVHVSNILGKLGVANRVEAAATAHRHGLLGTPE
ncbi:hypothetical protein BAY59_08300 [Prauserella coralliicola]|nr:hypothetical protein BAY59_08300 [Prauserella coralliicola]